MYHTIQFVGDFMIDIEVSPKQPLERILVRAGSSIRAQLRPFVAETTDGPVEVADLYFEDGSATRTVPFACFFFVD